MSPYRNEILTLAAIIVRAWEGLGDGDKLTPGYQVYICPAGWPTVGFGHRVVFNGRWAETLDEARKVYPNGVTADEAEDILQGDLAHTYDEMLRRDRQLMDLPVHQQAAMLSFALNLGAATWRSSTLWMLAKKGTRIQTGQSTLALWDYAHQSTADTLPEAYAVYCKARNSAGVKVPVWGLFKRRMCEHEIHRGGQADVAIAYWQRAKEPED